MESSPGYNRAYDKATKRFADWAKTKHPYGPVDLGADRFASWAKKKYPHEWRGVLELEMAMRPELQRTDTEWQAINDAADKRRQEAGARCLAKWRGAGIIA